MSILVLGHNQTTAPLELREQFVFEKNSLGQALAAIKGADAIREAVILSTCNRNEIYCVVTQPDDGAESVKEFLYRFHGVAPGSLDHTIYSFFDESAVRHLFDVTSGLDSLVVGETQVFSQVKEAYMAAHEVHATGLILNKLFHHSFEAGKKVRNLTLISQGAVSVSFAAVELAKKIFQRLDNKRVLLVGAGETGRLTARNLKHYGVTDITVSSRTAENAERLADVLGGSTASFAQLEEPALDADIIITSATTSEYIITTDRVKLLMKKRRFAPLFFIDLGVPRNIDPAVGRLNGVFLYNIDDLETIADENRRHRATEIEDARPIVNAQVGHFLRWYRSLEVTPTLVALRRQLEMIRTAELERQTKHLSNDDRERLEEVTRSIVNKILHHPSVEIKNAVQNGDGYMLTHAIRKLFRLTSTDE